MGDRFGAQDEHAVALGGDGKGPPDLAVYLDRPVGTGRQALAAADTGLVDDLRASSGSSPATAIASVGQTRTHAKHATQSSASMTKFNVA